MESPAVLVALVLARRLSDLRGARGPLITFAVVAPLVQGCLAVLVARPLDQPTGDALLLAVLQRFGGVCMVSEAMWPRHRAPPVE